MAAESRSRSEAPPAPSGSHFAVLGLQARHDLRREDVEAAYLTQAQTWHPDRVGPDDVGAKRRAMEASATINAAYRTLRDPVSRLEYLVKLGGIDLNSSDPEHGAPSPDQAFLIDMIERREQLSAASTAAAVSAFRAEVDDHEADALDAATAALAAGNVADAAQWLVQRRYWQRLLDEIDAGRPTEG